MQPQIPLLETSHEILSVSQFAFQARELLEQHFSVVWISGEISNLAQPSSGHLYFSLKDTNAQIRCALFRMQRRSLNFQPENGQHVVIRARASLYEGRGDFQLIVDYMELAGHGVLQQAYEALKKRLAAEGLFALENKKSIPSLPKAIGVITSPTGAAIRDILSVLRRRFPAIPIFIYPTLVQGAEAPKQIIAALKTAEKHNACDVFIIARGGGSIEDLWAFNDEMVVRAIFACHIPIISGIGHEIDFTIADFVADHRAPTPSAAAELCSPDCNQWEMKFNQFEMRLIQLIRNQLTQKQQTLSWICKRLQHPQQRLLNLMQRCDDLDQRLRLTQTHFLKHKTAQYAELVRALNAVSPLATLDRGYAIVTRADNNEILRNTDNINIGEKIITHLANGKLISEVKEIIDFSTAVIPASTD